MRKLLFALALFCSHLVFAQQIPLSGSIGLPGNASILGYQSIVMTDANYTLSSSEWAHNYLNVSSSVNLTATRSLILPVNQGQQYTIQNTTAGGQSILAVGAGGASGTGVLVPNGATAIVTSDGTNYISSNATVNASSLNTIINPASGQGPYTADPTGVADSTAAIQAALDTAAANTNGVNTVELPAGKFTIGTSTVFTGTTNTISFFCGTTNNSLILAGVNSFAGLAVGMPVWGRDIAVGATIVAMDTVGNTITMSIPATGDGSGVQAFVPLISNVSSFAGLSVGQYVTSSTFDSTQHMKIIALSPANDSITISYPALSAVSGAVFTAPAVPLWLQAGVKLRGQSQGTTIVNESPKGITSTIASWTCTSTIGTCSSPGSPIAFQGNTTTGSTAMTVSSIAGLVVGMPILGGWPFPNGTLITTPAPTGTTVNVSQAAIATAGGVTFTIPLKRYLNLTFPSASIQAPPFAFLQGPYDYFGVTTSNIFNVAGCGLATWFGTSPGTPFALYGSTGLSNIVLDHYNFFPGCTDPFTQVAAATTLQVAILSGTVTANSGTGGTLSIPLSPIMSYDSRHFAEAHDFEISDITFDGGCASCNTANAPFQYQGIYLFSKLQPAGGEFINANIHDLTFQNFPQGAIDALSVRNIKFTNIHCTVMGGGCIGGTYSDVIADTIIGDHIGFPFQGATGSYFTGLFAAGAGISQDMALNNVSILNSVFKPTTDTNNIPFGLGAFQAKVSLNPSHKIFHGLVIKNFLQVEGCQPGGGIFTGFVDDLLIDGITSDPSACGAVSPPAGTGFLEIGGTNNHITNGHNVRVVWAGIDSGFNHAANLEIDHIKWDAAYAPIGGMITISGEQAGGMTPCEFDNINIHDNQAFFDMTNPYTVLGVPNGLVGDGISIGAGEGSSGCAYVGVKVHHNQLHSFNGPNALPAFRILGQGKTLPIHGDLVNGSTSVINLTDVGGNTLPSPSGLVVGQPIYGNGIPLGTTIAALPTSSSLTLSAAYSGSNVSFQWLNVTQLPNSDWEFYDNQVTDFASFIDPMCAPLGGGGFDSNSTPVGTAVTNLRIMGNTADISLSNLVLNGTTGVTSPPNSKACNSMWSGVTTWGGNSWGGIDYNVAHSGVTASITPTASSCVSGTASIPNAQIGSHVDAQRTDGAALGAGTSIKGNVATAGTATINVCSGSSAEPAGTFNVSATNPQ